MVCCRALFLTEAEGFGPGRSIPSRGVTIPARLVTPEDVAAAAPSVLADFSELNVQQMGDGLMGGSLVAILNSHVNESKL